MKKTVIAAALLCATASFVTPAYASDPCETVLCLYGKATGNSGGGQCSGAEKAFFDILKWKKGSIRWSKTVNARKAFLNQCTTAPASAVSMIMSKFGKMR